MKTISIRLHPGQDLLSELDRLVADNQIKAACILTCVGSLTQAVLRFANQNESKKLEGFFEIVSLTGVLSEHGSHYHIAIADEEGRTYGAHLLEGCKIYTTAEIVIGICSGTEFLRTFDPQTGYPELEIKTATKE
ncbi:PPC domain-containing DNA-binding protein [Maridesulfovibrio sp.]|jgi:predicted DNA-binding protein with PD1-like motif|uniref:PPC domain-containing DNA-binding protein n=1 Tax=Maridesulfovibrio sp. TaxID=2795000 RepID=UPI0029CA296D|nr:PPC domain-containing DNA-binding protein [Maridesulfovibrio sp.]